MKKLIKKLNTYQLFTLIFIVLCIGVFLTFLKNVKNTPIHKTMKINVNR